MIVHTLRGVARSVSCSHDTEAGKILWTIELDLPRESPPNDAIVIHVATGLRDDFDVRTGDCIGVVGTIPGFMSGLRKVMQHDPSNTATAVRVHVEAQTVQNFSRRCVWSEA